MLTGSGVALILRVVGTPPDEPWTIDGWYIFAVVAGLSLLTKYVIKYRGTHVFNPSNIGLVVAFVVLGSSRVEPLDFWWAPLNVWMLDGLRGDHRRRPAHHATAAAADARGRVLDHARRCDRPACRVRALHDGELGVRAGLRRRLLAGHRHFARGPDLPLLHDHRPEDGARPARSAASSSDASSASRARCSSPLRPTSSEPRSACSPAWS